MKLKIYTLLVLFLMLGSWQEAQSQLTIDTSYTAEEMVFDFFSNSCVTPSNITYTGGNGSYAFFDAGNIDLGVQAGIFLGTGLAEEIPGSNVNSFLLSTSMGEEGDIDLDALLSNSVTNDAAVLEMDIVSSGNQVEFSYVFASEEYPEFVNSFNDIFAFFISGPGINGIQNIAMVPNSTDPVSINTINHLQNTEFYIDNAAGVDHKFDGYTTELIGTATVNPNETYHIKIAIADVGDSAYDSGIFLGIESLCGDSLFTPPSEMSVNIDGFTLSVENKSRYATSYLWDFGDNTTSTEKNPPAHTYAIDGYYDVTLVTQNYCCSDTSVTSVTIGNPTTGVKDLIVKPYLFSPNPVNDFAQLVFDKGELFEVKIFDARGQLVQQEKGNGALELGFQDFTPGVYFMQVLSEGKTYHDKFLKL